MNCAKCGASNAEGAAFCSRCGTPRAADDADGQSASQGAPGTLGPARTLHEDSSGPAAAPRVPAGTLGGLPTLHVGVGSEGLELGNRIGPLAPDGLPRYEIHEKLGSGSMGVVHRATDHGLQGTEVALKVVRTELFGSESAKARLEQEALTARGLQHAHVLKVFGLDRDQGLSFLSMELLRGRSLREHLSGLQAFGRDMPVADVARVGLEMSEALAHAHSRGVIHRDVKPENIFLEDVGGSWTVKLLDFGIAGALEHDQMVALAGTATYLAPEHIKGQAASEASDLYALGVVLLECLTGDVAVGRYTDPSKRRADVPAAWDELIACLLEQEPSKRPESAAKVAEQLADRALVSAPVKSQPSRSVAPSRRWPWLAAMMLVGICGAGLAYQAGWLDQFLQRGAVPNGSTSSKHTSNTASGKNAEGRALSVREMDQASVVLMPSLTFRMGSEARPDQQPERRVTLSSFFLDEHEVTWEQYGRHVAATGQPLPTRPDWNPGTEHPVVNVSWAEAAGYCDWVGARLPTEAEWELAARGVEGREFPWGSAWPPLRQVANMADANSGYTWAVLEYQDDHPRTAPVGSFPDGASPDGFDDMAGNVWEWVADWHGSPADGPLTSRDPKGPVDGERRVVRGGSFRHVAAEALRGAHREALAPATRSDSVGFRCARGAN